MFIRKKISSTHSHHHNQTKIKHVKQYYNWTVPTRHTIQYVKQPTAKTLKKHNKINQQVLTYLCEKHDKKLGIYLNQFRYIPKSI